MLDDLERALEAAERARGGEARRGRRLVDAARGRARLAKGLAEIETDGPFDPHVHEALLAQPARGRRARARCSRSSRRATGSATASCGRPAWSWPSSRAMARRPVRGARRREERLRRRDQEGLPQARRASTTRTRTRATPPPRSASRRSRAPTTSSPTRRSASSTTRSARPARRRVPGGLRRRALRGLRPRRPRRPPRRPLRRRRQARQRPAAERGNDLEVARAASRSRTRSKGVAGTRSRSRSRPPATTCDGTGAEPGTAPMICPQCGGRGVVSESQGLFALSQPCPRCRGNGTIIEKPCTTLPRHRAASGARSATR